MSCREANQRMMLALSGELSRRERKYLEKHLKGCKACSRAWQENQETWRQMQQLSQTEPDPEIREAIIERAGEALKSRATQKHEKKWLEKWFPGPRIAWGTSLAAAAVVLAIIFVWPKLRSNLGGVGANSIGLEWEDTFIQEADWLGQEIDRVESGSLLPYYASQDIETEEDESEWLSPMSGDLNRIRDKVQDLVKTIYGI